MEEITIYTDGACSGNPGPGGWGAVLMYKGNKKEISGGKLNTTNNEMEISAVIQALKMLKYPCNVKLYSDSVYELTKIHKVEFIKVKGHSDNEYNNRCDELARTAIKNL